LNAPASFPTKRGLCNEEIGSALGLGYALSVSGLIEAVQGNLNKALEQVNEVDKMTAMQSRQPWFETTHVKMTSLGLIAAVWYEQDRLDEVDELLQRYLPLVMHQPSLDMQLFSYITYTRLKIAQGDFDAALDILKRVDLNSTTGWQFARAQRIVEWERVRIELLQGKLEQATLRAELLERTQLASGQPVGYSFVEELCGARY
jgi:LuxR family maltose regulon positive regulatory protein